jgi:alpha-glucosidase
MDKETLHFSRPGGWEVVMSFEGKGVKVPKGEVAISSGKLEGGEVPKDTTVWVTAT